MFLTRILAPGILTDRFTLFTLPTLLLLLGFFISSGFGTAFAVSPMPSEIEKDLERKSMDQVKPTENNIVCRTKIVYINGKPHREDYVSSIAMGATMSGKDALEKPIMYFEDKLQDEDISEVSVDCKFPASGLKE